MAYQSPSIGPAGLSLPVYADVISHFVSNYQALYGQQAYLANDSADYQLLSTLALAINDAYAALRLVYNNSAPPGAVGAALDRLGKLIGGIARHIPTYSSCPVILTGTAGTVITNGVAQDVNGNLWSLPTTVTIGSGGMVTVTAICQTLGSITATPSQINQLYSGITKGWNTVNNTAEATPGQPVEADSQFRAREELSASIPSQTMLTGTIADIYNVLGVTRQNTSAAIENYTNLNPDWWGNPDHSISMVVEGGSDQEVATTIYVNKGPGAYTNGTTAVLVTDPQTGYQLVIRFFRPTYIQFTIEVDIALLAGGTSATIDAINQAIFVYLNSGRIGQMLTLSGLEGAIMAVTPTLLAPIFAIRRLQVTYTNLVLTAAVDAAGSGYSEGDVLIIAQPNSSKTAQVSVLTVDGSGGVATCALIQNGTDYVTATGIATVYADSVPPTLTPDGPGSGCTISITAGTPTDEGAELDIGIAFNEAWQAVSGNIVVTQVQS